MKELALINPPFHVLKYCDVEYDIKDIEGHNIHVDSLTEANGAL